MKFMAISFGPGSLVRFRDVKSHNWAYGIYRGVETRNGQAVGYLFSETPLGPISRWLAYWPKFIECAVTPRAAHPPIAAPSSTGEPSEADQGSVNEPSYGHDIANGQLTTAMATVAEDGTTHITLLGSRPPQIKNSHTPTGADHDHD